MGFGDMGKEGWGRGRVRRRDGMREEYCARRRAVGDCWMWIGNIRDRVGLERVVCGLYSGMEGREQVALRVV